MSFFSFDNALGWMALIKTLHLLRYFHTDHEKSAVKLLIKPT